MITIETIQLPLTRFEREHALRQLELARTDAAAARTHMQIPRPAAAPPVADVRAACYDAVEHLYDVLQVDVPADMVEDVRHAVGELQAAIRVLDRAERPGAHPPEPPIAQLDRTLEWLTRLEQQLRS